MVEPGSQWPWNSADSLQTVAWRSGVRRMQAPAGIKFPLPGVQTSWKKALFRQERPHVSSEHTPAAAGAAQALQHGHLQARWQQRHAYFEQAHASFEQRRLSHHGPADLHSCQASNTNPSAGPASPRHWPAQCSLHAQAQAATATHAQLGLLAQRTCLFLSTGESSP